MSKATKTLARAAAYAALYGSFAVAAHAQDASEASLEVTIRLLPENAVGPGELTRRIELPPAAEGARPPPRDERPSGAENERGRGNDAAAPEARGRGNDNADATRERSNETADAARRRGNETADAARERRNETAEAARERGNDAADDAREGNRGRALGREVAEQTRENREDAGRRNDTGPQNGRRDPPGRPSTPPGQEKKD